VLITDILLLISLLGFCIIWCWHGLGPRNAVLWGLATAAVVFSVVGVPGGRWQAAAGGIVAVVFLLVLVIRHVRGAQLRTGVPLASGTLFVLLTGVALAPLYLVPVFSLPAPPGPYAVGVRDFELTDHNRLGVLDAPADQPRRLAVRVWYPAQTVDGFARRPYATDAELRSTFPWLATEELSLPSFFFSHLRHVRTFSYEGAPALDNGQPLPVIFFSHGLYAFASQNTALMEHLASLGYMVFSIAHTYDVAPVVFQNGDVLEVPAGFREEQARKNSELPGSVRDFIRDTGRKFDKGKTYSERYEGFVGNIKLKWMTSDRVLLESPPVWLADRLFVVDALATGDAPDTIADLLARADLSRVGHMGMSFGGSAAAAAAYEDPRSAAVVNLDGSDFHHTRTTNADIPVPFMMLYSDSIADFGTIEGPPAKPFGFNDFSYERFSTAGLRDDVTRLHVQGVTHPGVSDFPLMLRWPLRSQLTGPLDGYRMVAIVNAFVAGFFDKYLRGAVNDFPREQFARYADDVVPHDVTGVREWWLSKPSEERVALKHELEEARSAPLPEYAVIAQ